ncbi:MAG TPA: hypothetical protein VF320_04400 [Acidimicrobiales bacterium]
MSAPAGAASASPSQATTVTVTSSRPDATTAFSGSPVTLRAQVAPTLLPPHIHITGSVAWTITGSDGSTLGCGRVLPLHNNGKTVCFVNSGQLVASASPYTVTADYSGDANFQASSGTFSQAVGLRATRLRISLDAAPTSGAATTVNVLVEAGQGTSLVSGLAVFATASSNHAVKAACALSNAQPVVGALATCQLPAGWMTVRAPTPSVPHPLTRWQITVAYSGNSSFGPSNKSMQGAAH